MKSPIRTLTGVAASLLALACTEGTSLDEFRLSDIEQSADWITTSYDNQRPGSTFLVVGAEAAP